MLKRFYITMTLWFLAICALGLYARTTPDGLSVVLLGILPIGLFFILLLLFYVPSKPTADRWSTMGNPGGWTDTTAAAAPIVVDWAGRAETYPVVPQRQCDTMQLRPGRPVLRLVKTHHD